MLSTVWGYDYINLRFARKYSVSKKTYFSVIILFSGLFFSCFKLQSPQLCNFEKNHLTPRNLGFLKYINLHSPALISSAQSLETVVVALPAHSPLQRESLCNVFPHKPLV